MSDPEKLVGNLGEFSSLNVSESDSDGPARPFPLGAIPGSLDLPRWSTILYDIAFVGGWWSTFVYSNIRIFVYSCVVHVDQITSMKGTQIGRKEIQFKVSRSGTKEREEEKEKKRDRPKLSCQGNANDILNSASNMRTRHVCHNCRWVVHARSAGTKGNQKEREYGTKGDEIKRRRTRKRHYQITRIERKKKLTLTVVAMEQ